MVLMSDVYSAPKFKFSNWEISVLVNVIHLKEEGNNVTRCRLDLNSKSWDHLHT